MKVEHLVTVAAGAGAAYLVFHMSRPVAHALASVVKPKPKLTPVQAAKAAKAKAAKTAIVHHALSTPTDIPEHAVTLHEPEVVTARAPRVTPKHLPTHQDTPASVLTPASDTPPDASASSSEPEAIVHRTPKQAAKSLYDFVKGRISAGQGSELHGKYNEIVDKAQRDMGGTKLKAAIDKGQAGIYGPLTRARGKELLGMEFPAV